MRLHDDRFKRTFAAAAFLVLPLAFSGGCGRSTDTSPEAPGNSSASASTERASTERASTTSDAVVGDGKLAEIASWQSIRDSIAGNDSVTVIDLWSLSCIPCLKEFPGLVELDQKLGERVACLAVNVDFDGRKTRPPETYQKRVDEFLVSVGAEFPNFISSTPSETLFTAADVVTIPSVLVFGKDGELIKVFTATGPGAEFNYADDVIPLVESLTRS